MEKAKPEKKNKKMEGSPPSPPRNEERAKAAERAGWRKGAPPVVELEKIEVGEKLKVAVPKDEKFWSDLERRTCLTRAVLLHKVQRKYKSASNKGKGETTDRRRVFKVHVKQAGFFLVEKEGVLYTVSPVLDHGVDGKTLQWEKFFRVYQTSNSKKLLDPPNMYWILPHDNDELSAAFGVQLKESVKAPPSESGNCNKGNNNNMRENPDDYEDLL